MSKPITFLLALTSFAIIGGCSDKADKRSDDVFKATPSQEAGKNQNS